MQKGTRPGQQRNRRGICNQRRGTSLVCTPGSILRLVIHRSLVPGILALVHTTYGHPGVARTTELTQRKYHWTSLKGDIRNYVLSCECQRLKRSSSQRVTMLPARFLQPWEVLEMNIHDMGVRLAAGNKNLLVVVDRASKFRFAYPLPHKTRRMRPRKSSNCC